MFVPVRSSRDRSLFFANFEHLPAMFTCARSVHQKGADSTCVSWPAPYISKSRCLNVTWKTERQRSCAVVKDDWARSASPIHRLDSGLPYNWTIVSSGSNLQTPRTTNAETQPQIVSKVAATQAQSTVRVDG